MRWRAGIVDWTGKTALVGAFYVITGKMGFLLAIPPGNVTAVWPPSGIAWAGILLWGPRVWPGIWLGSFLLNTQFFLSQAGWGVSELLVSALIATASTVQALAGAWLVRYYSDWQPFRSFRSVVRFSGFAPVCCTLAASVGTFSLYLFGHVPAASLAQTWLTWWMGDLIGVLLFTPLIMTWKKPPADAWSARAVVEALALAAGMFAVGRFIFGDWGPLGIRKEPLGFAMTPFLIWAAVRFGPFAVMLAGVILSWIAITGTIHGLGPFARHAISQSLFQLQSFIGIATMTGLLLAMSLQERHETEKRLRRDHGELKLRMRDTQMQLIQADKLQSVGRLSAGTAHEVKNVLAALMMGIDYLSRRISPDKPDDSLVLREMSSAVARGDGIIKGLLDFSSARKMELLPTDINSIIERSLLLVQYELRRRRIELIRRLDPALPPVLADGPKMQQVFLNLLMNSIDAMSSGGTLSVASGANEDGVLVEIQDTGTGIDEQSLPKLFELFFTTKPAGTGTGLGLAVSRSIVELHGGRLEIKNRKEGGVRALVLLRLSAAEHAGQDREEGRLSLPAGRAADS